MIIYTVHLSMQQIWKRLFCVARSAAIYLLAPTVIRVFPPIGIARYIQSTSVRTALTDI